MQASQLDLHDSSMPRYELGFNSPSTDTTASLSPNKERQLTNRIQNLELLVSNLMTRIIELEKNNSDLQINTTYDWSKATKKELNRSKSNLIDYFVRYRSGSKSI